MTSCAVILAGGQATRMGGGDKCRLMLGETSLLQQVLTRIQPQVEECLLNANGDLTRFEDLDLPIRPDTVPDFAGPLAGVLAGLDYAAERGHDWVISVAADTPFFPLDLVARLSQPQTQVCLAATPDPQRGRLPQPTFGRYHIALREPLREALVQGVRKIRQFTQAHGEALALFDTDDFFNINTPEDLAQARSRLS